MDSAMVKKPLRKNEPKIQDVMSASDKPPRAPVLRMMATGPVQANKKPTTAFRAYTPPKSLKKWAGVAAEPDGFSIGELMGDMKGAWLFIQTLWRASTSELRLRYHAKT